MALASPKLSICIPTYNRSRYLGKALSELFRRQAFDFDFEVVISDNASSDDTQELVQKFGQKHSQIRYVKQAKTVDVDENVVTALRLGQGEYVMYLADDDMLLPDAVGNVINYLEQRQNVAVAFSPWELYNDVTKQSEGLFYQHDAEMVFTRSTAIDLCNAIVSRHIFPEIFIYRSEALRKILYQPSHVYWAFCNLVNVLNYGDAAFLPKPFYRSVTQHWEGEHRVQDGNKHATSQWDSYRGGIEYMIFRAFTYAGFPSIPDQHRETSNQMVKGFVETRMRVALRMLTVQRQYLRAHELFTRLLANGALPESDIDTYRGYLVGRAAAEAFVRTFRAITRTSRVALFHVADSAGVSGLIAELEPDLVVEILDGVDPASVADKDRYLVLTGEGDHRQTLVDAGFPAGQVWAEGDLVRQYAI